MNTSVLAPESPPTCLPLQGLLVDIDGVLRNEDQVIPGAIETIEYLKKQEIPFLLATNTTRRSRYTLSNNLRRLGFKISVNHIFSAPFAGARWLKEHQVKSIFLFLGGDAYREFTSFRITSRKPEYVVLGDVSDDLTYANLNQVFRLIMGGAKMLALQKNRYWMRADGLAVDAGAIVAALEYATQKRAVVVGKPSPDFFRQAVEQLRLPAHRVAIVGDDPEADIAGGKRAGLFTIGVRTGKFPAKKIRSKARQPDILLSSIAELPEWWERQRRAPVDDFGKNNLNPSQEGLP